MAAPLPLGLRPLEPVYVSPAAYPGDKCLCTWSYRDHNSFEEKWQLKYVNSACFWNRHYALAEQIALAVRNRDVLMRITRQKGTSVRK